MKTFLLDTNVLLALAWPNHVHHDAVHVWFSNAVPAFSTCPLTQTGFVRISSNPSFTRSAVLPFEAASLLDRITQLPGHVFWPDVIPLQAAFDAAPPVVGHRQVVDRYLIALALHHGGSVATLDRAMRSAAADPDSVELLLDDPAV